MVLVDGGGIIEEPGTPTVSDRNLLLKKREPRRARHLQTLGRGAIINDGTLTVSNSTFSGNSASFYGGAIGNVGTLTVSNSTFSGNSATAGGGMYNNGGTTTLKNTLVPSNPGGNCGGTITDGGGNLSSGDATCPGINGDPKLGPLQDNGGPTQTMALGAGAPPGTRQSTPSVRPRRSITSTSAA